MSNMTDRGLVAIRREAGGRATVTVCARVVRGRPAGAFAVHANVPTVVVDPGIQLWSTDDLRYSAAVVEVFRGDDGTVHIQSIPD